MAWNADKGKYEYRVKGSIDPDGWVTVTSSLGGSVTASVNYKDVLDEVVIKRAVYKVGDQELRIEAYASGQPDMVLTVSGYGQMVWKADKNRYEYKIKPVAHPTDGVVTVIADTGQSASTLVEVEDDD
jgi:hypothetical protein